MNLTGIMKGFLLLLQRLLGKTRKMPLHTPEELECFKRDAIENRRKPVSYTHLTLPTIYSV